jgi:hypothetical protein
MVLGLGVRILGSGFRVQGLGLEKALLLDYTSLSVSLRETPPTLDSQEFAQIGSF